MKCIPYVWVLSGCCGTKIKRPNRTQTYGIQLRELQKLHEMVNNRAAALIASRVVGLPSLCGILALRARLKTCTGMLFYTTQVSSGRVIDTGSDVFPVIEA